MLTVPAIHQVYDRTNAKHVLKEYSVILTTSFCGMNQ